MATTRRTTASPTPRRDGRYMATADIAEDSRDVGVRGTPQQAGRDTLKALGEPYANGMTDGATLDADGAS
jgi:hypothetical protein